MTRKKLLLILVVSILAVSIPVTVALIHQGQQPPNGGTADVPTDEPTDEPTDTPTTHSTLTILSTAKGSVFVLKAGTDSWIEAQVGMSLEVGDTIKTSDASGAEITFFDGSTIELQAGTEIEVTSLGVSDAGSTTIKLKQAIGNTISRVTKLVDPASSYEVETPTGVAAVRGSILIVRIIEDGTSWITNQEGNIWVIANGVELQVPEGRQCIIMSGQPPQLIPSSRGGGGGGGSSPNPDISITKMPDLMQVHVGDAVTYTYTVTNPGNVPLSSVSVTDDMIEYVPYQSGDTNGDGRLGTDETWIFTATYNVTTQDIDPLVNNAAAAGAYAGSQAIIDWTKATVDILRPAVAINKTAEPVQAHDGHTVTYTYTVTNPGNTPLSAISVTDDKVGNITYDGDYQSGDTNGDEILDVDETWVFTATYNVTNDDVSPLVNTATASGTDALSRSVESEEDIASVDILRPAVAINKTAEPEQAHDGDGITYTYTVTNPGNVPLSGVSVTDDKIEDVVYQSGDTNGDGRLDTDETWVFTATYTMTAEDDSPLVNTATVSGTDALSRSVKSEDTASVDILRPAIALNKTAEPEQAHDGDGITYTYNITNPGNTPLSAISVTDDKAGNITYEGGYQSGDTNGDEILDIDETWVFTATYNVTADDVSPLVNTATATGADALAQTVTAQAAASVTIIRLEVEITSPEDGDTITSRTVTVTGTVSDLTVTEATIDINGASHTIAVENGSFSSDENVSSDVNVITVTATNGVVIASDMVTITVHIPTYGIRVELSWDTSGTDLDAHLIRPSGQYWAIPDDCHWQNKNPDWGLREVTEDDPSLDQDDRDGYGPENITLEQPYEQGIYQYQVHYYSDQGHGPSMATVRVWINDVKVAEYSKEMSTYQVWDCFSIDWPSGQVTSTQE